MRNKKNVSKWYEHTAIDWCVVSVMVGIVQLRF